MIKIHTWESAREQQPRLEDGTDKWRWYAVSLESVGDFYIARYRREVFNWPKCIATLCLGWLGGAMVTGLLSEYMRHLSR